MTAPISPKRTALLAAARERILVLDGAMGTMIQALQPRRGRAIAARASTPGTARCAATTTLILTQPQTRSKTSTLEATSSAGADIVSTNTFSSTTRSRRPTTACRRHRLRAQPRRRQACARGRRRAQAEDGIRRAFVAGALGPTNRTASISPDVSNPGYRAITFDDLRMAYGEQIKGLLDGGADLLLIETIFDTLNAKAAIYAIAEPAFERGAWTLPVMISGTITDRSGPPAVGADAGGVLECGVARQARCHHRLELRARRQGDARPHRRSSAASPTLFVCAYPNAGLPNEFGQLRREPGIHGRADRGIRLSAGLVNIVGGCCGTTPDHIAAIAAAVKGKTPRVKFRDRRRRLRLSGLEPFTLTPAIPFVNVGERTNVTGSAKFRKLVTAGDYTAALDHCRATRSRTAPRSSTSTWTKACSIPKPRW